MSENKPNQMPLLGGIILGTGLGLVLFPLLVNLGFAETFGVAAIILFAIVFIVLGAAIGFSSGKRGKSES